VPLSDLLDTVGPLGRTVGVVMTLFSVLTGSRMPSPAALEGVRIGILELAVEMDPTVEEAVRDMIDLVASRAGAMRRVPLDLDFRRVRLAGLLDVEAGGSAYLEEVLATHPEGFSEHFRSMLEFASTKTAVDLVKSQRLLAQVSRQIEPLFEDVDVLMCATVGRFPDRIEDGEVADAADICAFANAAGIPAVSIPIATSGSLPTGLQLIGPRGSDATLLSVAAGVEKLTGWDPTVAVSGT
jgi:Asp-tRNA(Asn)/Glu-tRNA(Gln) amidotransferase A subunit family amidase